MKPKNIFVLAGLCLLTYGISSCNNNDDEVSYMLPETRKVNLTDNQRNTVTANNLFAAKLFRKTYEQADGKSFSLSPMGVTYMLGLISNGASNEAQKEIVDALGSPMATIEDINELCQTMIEGLPNTDKQVKLETANAIFTNKEYKLQANFIQKAQKHYRAKATSLDFTKPQAANTINNWIQEQTHGQITTLVNEINPMATLYLLNTTYFQATWAKQFDKAKTTQDNFYTTERGAIQIPMMHNKAVIRHYANDFCRMIQLPYGSGEAWDMFLIMPQNGNSIRDIMDKMNPETWKAFWKGGENKILDLHLPKFRTENQTDLKMLLPELGVRRIFNTEGELTNLCIGKRLHVGEMIQANGIEVNEEGTKMVTINIADCIVEDYAPDKPQYADFRADRPFIYFIRESSTNAVLFMGAFQGY